MSTQDHAPISEPTTNVVASTTIDKNNNNNTNDKSKEKKKPEPPGPFGQFVIFAIIYFIGISIVLNIIVLIIGKENEADISAVENLYTPADSGVRSLVNGVQFLIRASVVLLGLGIGSILLLLGLFFAFGALILYVTFSTEFAEWDFLKRKPSILLFPAMGFPIGYFLLWPPIDPETGKKDVPWFLAWLVEDSGQYGVLMTFLLLLACISLWKVGMDKDKEAEKRKKLYEHQMKNIMRHIADTLQDSKIGEMTFEDGSTQDISANDALKVVMSVTKTKEQRMDELAQKDENLYFKSGRFVFGIMYGFFSGFLLESFKALFLPPLMSIFFGGENSFLLVFLWEGFRAGNALLEQQK